MAPIGIVLGSYNDVERISAAIQRLEELAVPFEIQIASAHRTPERLEAWLADAQKRGMRVIIAAAGAAAHLPGVVASKCLLPVIGLPLDASTLHGTDALYSIVQMPPGIPVATVGIGAAENAAILALHILAVSDPAIRSKLEAFRASWKKKIEEQNTELFRRYPNARPDLSRNPVTPEAIHSASAPKAEQTGADFSDPQPPPPLDPSSDTFRSTSASRARKAVARKAGETTIYSVDPDMPGVEAIEQAVEVLLKGGIVALPTDTVYGLAADATNPDAVEKLYTIKGREVTKAIPVLIDSMQMFRTIAVSIPDGLDILLERHWPGPLTLITRKRPSALRGVSKDDTLGVRMPDSMVALGLINMLSRPLAVTSANLSGSAPATSADEVVGALGPQLDLVLDAGVTPGAGVSTILSVLDSPYVILREGLLTAAMLRETLADRLA